MNLTLPSVTFEEAARQMQAVDVDRLIDTQTLLPSSNEERLAQLARVYSAVRPLLALAASLPLPDAWRKALALLVAAIEAVVPPAPAAGFKAGRDLEE